MDRRSPGCCAIRAGRRGAALTWCIPGTHSRRRRRVGWCIAGRRLTARATSAAACFAPTNGQTDQQTSRKHHPRHSAHDSPSLARTSARNRRPCPRLLHRSRAGTISAALWTCNPSLEADLPQKLRNMSRRRPRNIARLSRSCSKSSLANRLRFISPAAQHFPHMPGSHSPLLCQGRCSAGGENCATFFRNRIRQDLEARARRRSPARVELTRGRACFIIPHKTECFQVRRAFDRIAKARKAPRCGPSTLRHRRRTKRWHPVGHP